MLLPLFLSMDDSEAVNNAGGGGSGSGGGGSGGGEQWRRRSMAAVVGAFDGGGSIWRHLMVTAFDGDGVWLKQGDGKAKMVFDTSGGGWRRRASMIAIMLRWQFEDNNNSNIHIHTFL
jgi:hypothetical protein